MRFLEEATVEGCPVLYKVHENAKRYTLLDNGFVETSAGNFRYERPLDATPQSKQGFILKITVAKNLETLKMSVTTANGLRSMNIFANESHAMNQEKFYFLMDGMIDRECFAKVE